MDAWDTMIVEQVRTHPWMLPLLRMLELFDGGVTYAHGWRVARGVLLASNGALTTDAHAERGKRIRAALLHDIGKMLTSRAIITKPDGLTPEEWAEVRRHPRLGFETVRVVDEPVAMEFVYHHECPWREVHERTKNYPRAEQRRAGVDRRMISRMTAGERRQIERRMQHEVPASAVILSLVDLVDALTDAHRPYLHGKAFPEAEIRDIVRKRFALLTGVGDVLLARRADLQRPVPSIAAVIRDI